MHYTLKAPTSIKTTITLPSSKSISNRALIIQQLAKSSIMPLNISDCDDTFVMLRALQNPSEITDIMAAGTAMRFLTAYRAVTPGQTIMTGTDRMRHRPIHILVDALRSLGAQIDYMEDEGFPPLRITGRTLEGGDITLPAGISSQFISALLMIGPVMKRGLTLHLTGHIVSRPYINLTLQLMRHYGAEVTVEDERHITVHPKPYCPSPLTVENDWSAASYWYEMLALCPDPDATVTLPGLLPESIQGDARIREFFVSLSVTTTFGPQGAVLTKTAMSHDRMELDLTDQPDLAQTLVVTCAMLGRPFRFTGLESLRVKETDRLKALRTELAKLGFTIKENNGNTLSCESRTGMTPESARKIVQIDTYEDHRMAMAFAPCALLLPQIAINNPEVVSKSYPHYWKDLEHAGYKIICS